MRKLLLAALVSLGWPAFAQAPPPVPALPDASRVTTYMLVASTCICAVGFPLYGDGTDFQNWLQVTVNDIAAPYNDPAIGWTITSPSGPIGNLPRPITDAVLTFNNPHNGAVRIVGDRRPRRPVQFQEGRGVTTREINQVFTDIISQNREIWDQLNAISH